MQALLAGERERRKDVANSREKPVGAAVAEWDEGQGDEGRDSIADVSPVDPGDLANHHTANLPDTIVSEL